MLPEDISKVEEIIRAADEEIKSVEVNKKIPLQSDCGLLMVTDQNELDKLRLRNDLEQDDYMKELARDGIQFLLNDVWDLPTSNFDGLIYAQLPKTKFVLPREKRLPKPKPLTKWENFAKNKGLTKTKRPVKEWDDVVKDWIPRYGYQKVKAERDKNWLMEVPEGANPYEDQYKKAADEKKERIARNEYNRMKNIAKAKNVRVPNVGIGSNDLKSKSGLDSALAQTRYSTASLGKFQANLKSESSIPPPQRGKKRKRPSHSSTRDGILEDNKRALTILDNMKNKELDMEAAVNKQLRLDNIENSQNPKKAPKNKRRSKQGVVKHKSNYKKPVVFSGTASQIREKGKGRKFPAKGKGSLGAKHGKGAPVKRMAGKGGPHQGKGNKGKLRGRK